MNFLSPIRANKSADNLLQAQNILSNQLVWRSQKQELSC
jgi:hypothetical protein